MIYLVKNTTQTKFAYDYLKSEPILGADTETTGLDPITDKVLLIQLGTTEHQFVFDVARLSSEDLNLIFKIFESDEILKVFQNGKFDYKMLKSNFGVKTKYMADTMIVEQLLTKGVKQRGFGLAELTEKYRAGTLNKEIRAEFQHMKFGDEFSKEAIKYAADDVKVTPIIYDAQLKLADERGMRNLILLENETVRVNAELELNGIYIDQAAWLALEDKAYEDRDKAEAKLQTHFEKYFPTNLFGKVDINYSSVQQIKPVLEKILGRSLESTNEKYLKQFENDYEVIKDLFDFREASKKLSTYGKTFLEFVHPVTQRVHATYLQLGTDSGRESFKDPNMQNIPHAQAYRTPFCAQHPDYRIISADFANQELRVLAHLSGEQAFIDAIRDDRDLHTMVASMMFGLPESECTKEKDAENGYRTKAKTIGFGTIYGLSAFGLAKQLDIEKDEAQKLLKQFFTSFPNIKRFLNQMEAQTQAKKCAVSPLDGRIRDLGGMDWDDWRKRGHALNIGKNHPIQGASASITKLALVKVQDYIDANNKDAKIIAVVHDEILVECHVDIVDEMAKVVEDSMVEAFNHYCPDVPMSVEAEVASHWIH